LKTIIRNHDNYIKNANLIQDKLCYNTGKGLYIFMYFKEILLFFIPFLIVSVLHLYFCIRLKKRPADILKIALMPSLLLPVYAAWLTDYLPLNNLALLTGALVGAWAGDFFLIKPVSKKKFFYGLIAFFLSHIFYLSIFMPSSNAELIPITINIGIASAYSLLTAGIYVFIGKPKGLRGLASILYTIMLFLLQYSCLSPLFVNFFIEHRPLNFSRMLLVMGVFLFTISDIILAYSLFKREFKRSRFSVMSTYILAQFFLVSGVILCF